MVMPGQFLERPTLIPVGPQVLEGLAHRGGRRPSLLVLPPTPDEGGGGMDHLVAAELAFAAARAGHPTLRFNYRGVGASQGSRGTGACLLDDALAALQLSADNAEGAPTLVASIGRSDRVALALAERAIVPIAALVLVSPTVSVEALAAVSVPVWVVVAEAERTPAWSALSKLVVVPRADQSWQRNLPMVGQAVVEALGAAARR